MWIIYTLSSTFLFSFLYILQKKIALKNKNQRAAAVIFNIMAFLISLIIFFIQSKKLDFVLPKNYISYFYLFLAVLFYGLFERLRFVVAEKVEAGILSIISNITLPIIFFWFIFSLSRAFYF